jgi:23S rRNA (uracil-5-)-methyltransferase RumA
MSASLSSAPEPRSGEGAETPRCRHFGSCGGCSHQDKSYDAQLALKRARVEALLAPLSIRVDEVLGSPEIWYYRNKMEFSFGDVYPPVPGGPVLKLGLKPKGRWYEILDLQECFLLSPETPALLRAVRAWAAEHQLLPYNSKRHTGLLRHLVVREAKNTGERMVLLVTSPGQIPTDSFVAAVRSAYPATTVMWGVNGKVSDTAISDQLGPLFGPGFIVETLKFGRDEIRYRVSPQAFFQTNTKGAERLYGLLRSWTTELAPQAALDLYCGGGGIALSLSGVVKKVYGAELNASAIADAKANAALNGITNAEFFSGSVETLLPSLLPLAPELAVVDPPRAGLHPSAVGPLLESGPKALLYVSCNAEALARDLAKLAPRYQVKRVAVVDLFPHTEHVETVVQLARN